MKKSLFREGFIEDNYLIDEDKHIGEGGTSIVRKGLHKATGKTVAVK
jgi:hypothetical protein